jgi:glycosyltransferase involved in cell wall biosynthesis
MQVSVIMPFWNAGQYVDAALRSVFRQSVPVQEVIIVDQGGSTPESAFPDHLRDLDGLHFISSPQTTPGKARNLALAAATGDAIAFLDADDLWPLGKLERQVSALQDHDLVGGFTRWFTETISGDVLEPSLTASVCLLMPLLGACLYRREFLEKLGHFDAEFVFSEDVDLLLRACESQGRILALRTVELYYRKNPQSVTHSHDPMRDPHYARAVRQSLERRGATGNRRGVHGLASYMEPTRALRTTK